MLLSRGARGAARLPLAPIAALGVGGAAAFFFGAMPVEMIGSLLDTIGLTDAVPVIAARLLLMALAAMVAGGATFAVFLILGRVERNAPRRGRAGADVEYAEAPVPRRADAHADAPPRRPIFAATDLGTPLDLIAPLPERWETAEAAAAPPPESWSVPPESITQEPDEAEWTDADVEASQPLSRADEADEAAPPRPESIAALMVRLEAGLARCGLAPDADAIAPPDVALRRALDALRPFAARR